MANLTSKRELSPKLNRTGWLFVIPSVILIVAFVFYPMVQALITSFQTGAGNNLTFTGISNYQRLLTDTTFRKALFNTVLYLIIQVPIMIILALVISSILNNKKLKFKGFFRTAIFLPCVTSLVAYSITITDVDPIKYNLLFIIKAKYSKAIQTHGGIFTHEKTNVSISRLHFFRTRRLRRRKTAL